MYEYVLPIESELGFMLKRLVLIVCIIIISGTASALNFKDVSDLEWNLVPPQDFPNEKAIILFDIGEMRVMAVPLQVKLVRYVRIKVFDKEAADEALTISIPYNKGDRVTGLKAHTINPDGKRIPVKKFFDKKAGVYREKVFTFPAVEDGAILEYKYQYANTRVFVVDPWYFQNKLYTLKSQLSFIPEPGVVFSCSDVSVPLNCRIPEEEEFMTLRGMSRKYTWTVVKVPPDKEQPYTGARLNYLMSLQFQLKYQSVYNRSSDYFVDYTYFWGMIDYQIEQLMKKSKKVVRKLSDSLCNEIEDSEKKIETCFKYVRDNIVTDENSGNKNFKEIILNGSGNTVDKNILLTQLLKHQGMESFPLLIGTRDDHDIINWEINQMRSINYTLCCIRDMDSARVYKSSDEHIVRAFDTSDKNSVYPFLPDLCLVRNGIMVTEDSVFALTVLHPERSSGTDLVSTVKVSKDNSAVCSTSVMLNGYTAHKYLDFIDNDISGDEWFRILFGDIDRDYTIEDSKVSYQRDQDRIVCDFVISIPQYGSQIDNIVLMTPLELTTFENPFNDEIRMYPVDFRFPFKDRVQITVVLPEGARVTEPMDDISHRVSNLSFRRRNVARNNVVKISSELNLFEPIIILRDFPLFKKTYDALEMMKSDQIVYTY